MTHFKTTIFAMTLVATAAFAHDGVQNEAVHARMTAMETIGANMKILAGMAKGQSAFSTDTANAALVAISDTATTIPALFEAQEDDPKSEAADEIWTNWEDFVAKAVDLETVTSPANGISDMAGLAAAMATLGGTCKACHREYKL